MGEAVEKPAAPETPDAAAAVPGLEASLSDDFLLFLEDSFPVLTGDAKQGKRDGVEGQEEEEEELEWLSNIDAFPPLDTSLTFGPTTVSPDSAALEALETVVVEELETEVVEEPETEEVRVPTKRRSPVLRRPRQVFFSLPFLRASESKMEEQPSVRRCTHCKVKQTPQWRQGPEGPGTLCNACGVRYKSGRLYDEYRPANSPTFSPRKHSNFHRKVLEMRGEKQTDGVVVTLGRKGGRRSSLGGSEWGGEVHAGDGSGTRIMNL